MSYPQYQDDLNTMLEAEIFALAVCSTGIRLARTRQALDKWQQMDDLQSQHLQRLREFLAERELNAVVRPWVRLQGVALATEVSILPWTMSMQAVHDASQPFMPAFQRLAQYGDAETQRFLEDAHAHQQAIARIALQEMAA